MAARPTTDISDGLNTGEVGTDMPPPDRIPVMAVSSSPPTTAVTVDATAACSRRVRAQVLYRFEETMERSTTADQLTDHEAIAAQNQPTHGETGGEATDLKTSGESAQQP